MAKDRKQSKKRKVESYTHRGKKRLNNPTVGLTPEPPGTFSGPAVTPATSPTSMSPRADRSFVTTDSDQEKGS